MLCDHNGDQLLALCDGEGEAPSMDFKDLLIQWRPARFLHIPPSCIERERETKTKMKQYIYIYMREYKYMRYIYIHV